MDQTTESELKVSYSFANTSDTFDDVILPDPVKAIIKKIWEILLIAVIFIIMLSLGCTIEPRTILDQIKKPVPILLGMLIQFVVYPLLTFSLVHVLRLSSYDALGALLLTTCPGGTLSNLITFWCDGDVVLSICMTWLATALAIGMMPLNLWIYTRGFVTDDLKIPYIKIIIGLVITIVPVAIGMIISRKLPKVAGIIVKLGGLLGFLVILIIVSLNLYLYPDMMKSDWRMVVLAVMLPGIGLVVSYGGTQLACMSHVHSRTIAIEIATQNVSLSLTLIYVSFSDVKAMKIATFSLIFGMFSVISVCIFTFIYKIVKHVRKLKRRSILREGNNQSNDSSL